MRGVSYCQAWLALIILTLYLPDQIKLDVRQAYLSSNQRGIEEHQHHCSIAPNTVQTLAKNQTRA